VEGGGDFAALPPNADIHESVVAESAQTENQAAE
jgi:hypothetical protein